MSETPTPLVPAFGAHSITKGGSAFQARAFKDNAARWVVWVGGLGVIAALLLIFFYLVVEVAPLFAPADFKARPAYAVPGQGKTLYATVEEQGQIAMRVSDLGEVTFFDLNTGAVRATQQLALNGLTVVDVTEVSAERGELAVSLSDGSILQFAHQYDITYPDDKQLITPSLRFPKGEATTPFMSEAAQNLVVRENGDSQMLFGVDAAKQVHIKTFSRSENAITGEVSVEVAGELQFKPVVAADLLLVEPLLSWLYVIDQKAGKIAFYKLDGASEPKLIAVPVRWHLDHRGADQRQVVAVVSGA